MIVEMIGIYDTCFECGQDTLTEEYFDLEMCENCLLTNGENSGIMSTSNNERNDNERSN